MKHRLLILGILVLFMFLRFFELEERMQFTWDQVENSWMMKNILIDGRLPLQGMVAKGNTGFYIGPAYYYLLALFYKVFDLDPIAGAYFVGIVSLLTLIVLMYLTRKMFNRVTALFAGLLYTITYYIIGFDRIPWPVVFIPIVSIVIFYYLWRLIEGSEQSLLFLAFFHGFAFHIHFTAIFFPMITLVVFLFIRWTKTKLFLLVPSFILFFIWFIPSIIASIQSGGRDIHSFMSYISLYYHGLHGRRVLQVLPDVFIELKEIIAIRPVHVLAYLVIPLFFLLIYFNRKQVARMKKIMPVFLWFLIPLFVFSVYKGEISNYYYSLLRPVSVIIVSYILSVFFHLNLFLRVCVISYLMYISALNIQNFLAYNYRAFPKVRGEAKRIVEQGGFVPFVQGDGLSYMYYYYRYKNEGVWPK